eukprot:scaffold90831_cov56-Phaeocystis_antarctica.AAC.1
MGVGASENLTVGYLRVGDHTSLLGQRVEEGADSVLRPHRVRKFRRVRSHAPPRRAAAHGTNGTKLAPACQLAD